MPGPAPEAVTRLLVDWGKGSEQARVDLEPALYDELRRLARGYMSRERKGHTLQPTALVHEAYMRLVDQRQVDFRNRAQFVGLAAVMMRRILVNHAREHAAAKRGADAEKVTLGLAADVSPRPEVDVLAVHDALDRLAAMDARKARVVEMKFFGGLTTAEVAEALGCSTATVEREWSFARAWLFDALGAEG
jgi:RNA polymerase sigma factor (TIGR02999 family)